MARELHTQNDQLGTSLVNADGKITGVRMHCPHCGMIDYKNVNQSSAHAHWEIWRVGGVRYYQCGKCRKYFYSLEVQVPLDIEPMELYKNINSEFDVKE